MANVWLFWLHNSEVSISVIISSYNSDDNTSELRWAGDICPVTQWNKGQTENQNKQSSSLSR